MLVADDPHARVVQARPVGLQHLLDVRRPGLGRPDVEIDPLGHSALTSSSPRPLPPAGHSTIILHRAGEPPPSAAPAARKPSRCTTRPPARVATPSTTRGSTACRAPPPCSERHSARSRRRGRLALEVGPTAGAQEQRGQPPEVLLPVRVQGLEQLPRVDRPRRPPPCGRRARPGSARRAGRRGSAAGTSPALRAAAPRAAPAAGWCGRSRTPGPRSRGCRAAPRPGRCRCRAR